MDWHVDKAPASVTKYSSKNKGKVFTVQLNRFSKDTKDTIKEKLLKGCKENQIQTGRIVPEEIKEEEHLSSRFNSSSDERPQEPELIQIN